MRRFKVHGSSHVSPIEVHNFFTSGALVSFTIGSSNQECVALSTDDFVRIGE